MAYEGPALMVPGLVAGAGLTDTVSPSVQFKFVKLSSDRTVALVSATTDVPIGVLQAPVKATGDPVTVMASGISKLRLAAGSPTANDLIGADADGQALTISVPQANDYIAGRILEAAAGASVASGVIGTALIDCTAPARAA